MEVRPASDPVRSADQLLESAPGLFDKTPSPVLGRGGMVGAGHPLAVAAGVDALRKGGNAMDAAIAAALTAGVTIPAMGGLGGDAFLIYFDSSTKEVVALNSSGIAPRALSRDYFVSRGYKEIPKHGPLSIGVPGAVSAYFEAIRRWCSFSVDDLFSHAIHYAEHGFPLSRRGEHTIAVAREKLATYQSAAAIFLRDGRPPQEGDLIVQRALARTLRQLATGGPESFYDGEIAQRIVAAVRDAGGELTVQDMSLHSCDVYQPLSTEYRGHTVYQTSLPTHGHIALEILNIVENADLRTMGHNSADALHLMIEANKCAFADRNAFSRDPNFGPTPLDTILSKEFAAERYATIDADRASETEESGIIPGLSGDTTYLCTADSYGNMVSFIQSLSAGFGSGIVAGDTGVVLNNRVGGGFTLAAGHPNVIEGGKRTMHTLNAYAIAKQDQVLIVGGTPGGCHQPQWNAHVISNLIDFGMDVQQAVGAARWQSFPGTDANSLPMPYELRLESRIRNDAIDGLRRRGHKLEVVGPYATGGAAFLIRRNPKTGVLEGGRDPRSEGLALAL